MDWYINYMWAIFLEQVHCNTLDLLSLIYYLDILVVQCAEKHLATLEKYYKHYYHVGILRQEQLLITRSWSFKVVHSSLLLYIMRSASRNKALLVL